MSAEFLDHVLNEKPWDKPEYIPQEAPVHEQRRDLGKWDAVIAPMVDKVSAQLPVPPRPADGEPLFPPLLAPIERKAEAGKRFDAGKLRFDLMPPEWESILAQVMTLGAVKYSDNNWRKGMSWSRCYAALRRHLNAFWKGENLDKETGLPHLAHAAWGCLAIITYMTEHPELDDRYRAGNVPPKA